MKGQLNMRSWARGAANNMGHIWVTDCDSMYQHLVSPRLNNVDNERLGVDLTALRQLIWARNGERTLEVDQSSLDRRERDDC